jgi:hypothetical protein
MRNMITEARKRRAAALREMRKRSLAAYRATERPGLLQLCPEGLTPNAMTGDGLGHPQRPHQIAPWQSFTFRPLPHGHWPLRPAFLSAGPVIVCSSGHPSE